MKLSEITGDAGAAKPLKLSDVTSAPADAAPPKFEPWGDTPLEAGMRSVARTVVPPVVNFLDYPVRAVAADVVGLARGGLPTDAPSREAFSREREKSLSATALPETPVAKKVTEGVGKAIGAVNQYGSPPQMALHAMGLDKAIAPFQTMVGDVLGLGGYSRAGAGAAKEGVESGAASIGKAVAKDSPKDIENFITNAYNKAIRPTVAGKGSAAKIDQADRNVISGLSSIVGNKANLRLVDKNGKEVIGRSPQTLDEFVQATSQTMRPVFDRYDSLARQAEGLGVKIETSPIAAELGKFINDPAFNLPKFDAMKAYAKETAEMLAVQGNLSPTVAQKMVRNLNEGLTAFYRSSSPEAATRAAVDDLVANKLREGVDTELSKAGLPGWQEARLAYGALKAIEGEVAHRAVVYGRHDPGGGVIGRLGSIASYEELARFAVSHDPHALAAAAAIKGGRKLTEYLHSPNRAVKRMFEKAEKLQSELGPVPPPMPPATGVQTGQPLGPAQSIRGTQGGPGGVQGGGSDGPGPNLGPQYSGAPQASGPVQKLRSVQGGPSAEGAIPGGGATQAAQSIGLRPTRSQPSIEDLYGNTYIPGGGGGVGF